MNWTFSKSLRTLSHPAGETFPAWSCPAASIPVAPHEPIENGTYPFGPPEYNEPWETEDLTAMGPYFIPVNRANNKGVHGGGSAAPEPLAAKQGLYPTEGCIRVQNVDLYHIVLNLGAGDTLTVED